MAALARGVLAAVLVCLFSLPSLADRRVALVIGNGAYQHATPLSNPANDATDLSNALKTWGFKVILGVDLDKAKLDATIRDFAKELAESDTAVFFYAGHGIQVSGNNFIVPIDAKLASERDLDFEATRMDFVLRQMELGREDKTNIVFLDACRDNPLARNLARNMGTRSSKVGQGLAQVDAGVGTFISFSTQPGNVALDGQGRNSPFAAALAKRMLEPGRNLGGLMIDVRKDVLKETGGKQVPWDHSALTGEFYFDLAAVGQGLAKPSNAPPGAADTALKERLEKLEGELQSRDNVEQLALLEQLKEKRRDIELQNRDDQQTMFDMQRDQMRETDPQKRMQMTRQSMDLQMKIGRRSGEQKKLVERIGALEKKLNIDSGAKVDAKN